MPRKKSLIFSLLALVVICGFLAAPEPAFAARKEKVLYSFCSEQGCDDGAGYPSNLIFDAAGNLYGTTIFGGLYNSGVVFQLALGADGTWTEKVLYNFCSLQGCADGSAPQSGLIFDAAGNLYGTGLGGEGVGGVVYQLAPGADGTWTESVLHSFSYGEGLPWGDLVFDTAGNLYGATLRGGNPGTVFELKPQGNGTWSEETLYTFQGGSDGSVPFGPLVFDASGNLYGSTAQGGIGNGGTVYELMPQTNGTWKKKALHGFGVGSDGTFPSSVIFDAAGNLYGTTSSGGAHNNGTIFRLSPRSNGRWKEAVLRSFQRVRGPAASLVFDTAKNLYGTTYVGGPGCPPYGCGTVFEFNPATRAYKVLCAFSRDRRGHGPDSSLILDAAGNLYGTTMEGGAHGAGVVFEVMR